MSDDYKTAEQRGYAKGYAAGKKARVKVVSADARYRQREAFRQRAFLTVLPFAMSTHDWKRGDVAVHSIEDRVKLAVEIADCATKRMAS